MIKAAARMIVVGDFDLVLKIAENAWEGIAGPYLFSRGRLFPGLSMITKSNDHKHYHPS